MKEKMRENYECPYCGCHSILTKETTNKIAIGDWLPDDLGQKQINIEQRLCANELCGKSSFLIVGATINPYRQKFMKFSHPVTVPTNIPDYVPQSIRDDYYESFSIKDLSPKAAATLARRCLQGMLRDFWQVKRARLNKEIEQIKGKVEPITWDAIDAVRQIGNIGAHMEEDINVIIDVDEGEVDLLLQLIVDLINDWYVAREERDKRSKALIAAAANKKALQPGTPSPTTP